MSQSPTPESSSAIPRGVWIALMTIGALIVVLLAAVLYKISVPGSPQAPTSATTAATASAPGATSSTPGSQAPSSAQSAQQPRSAVAVTGTSPSRRAASRFPAMPEREGAAEGTRTAAAPSGGNAGAQSFQPQTFQQQAAPAAPVCSDCGTVEAVTPVQRQGSANGLGAVVGGVLGGVLGHQIGGGNGRTAATVIGAVGGGLAGNEVQKRMDSTTVYEVRIRMDNGATHVFTLNSAPPVGQRVRVGANGSISPM